MLEIRNLIASYGPVLAIRDISFTADVGKITTVTVE